MKKLITLLLVSAFLFAVTIIPAHAAECEQHNYIPPDESEQPGRSCVA